MNGLLNKSQSKYFYIVGPLHKSLNPNHLNKFVLFFFRATISAPVVQPEDYSFEYLTAEEVGQELGGN